MLNKWRFFLLANELVEAMGRLLSWDEHVSTSLWKEGLGGWRTLWPVTTPGSTVLWTCGKMQQL